MTQLFKNSMNVIGKLLGLIMIIIGSFLLLGTVFSIISFVMQNSNMHTRTSDGSEIGFFCIYGITGILLLCFGLLFLRNCNRKCDKK